MENLKEVDWSKAPEGATHYNVECEYPWLKETPASYFKGDGWIEYGGTSYKRATEHLGNAVKRHQGWDGSGVPPVGTECEYLFTNGEEWRKCDVVAHYFASVVAVDVLDGTATSLPAGLFRPIKTPEQIAAEDRENVIADMYGAVMGSDGIKGGLIALYDAGYRKTEVKK